MRSRRVSDGRARHSIEGDPIFLEAPSRETSQLGKQLAAFGFPRNTRAAFLGDANSRLHRLNNNQKIKAVICKPTPNFWTL